MRLVAVLLSFLILPLPVMAQELDGNALRELALRGIWASENADWGYWSWHEDDTVCVRLFDPQEDCADTGTWALEGKAICYELTWFGEAYDVRSNCFTVQSLDDNLFESLHHGGTMVSSFFTFSVID